MLFENHQQIRIHRINNPLIRKISPSIAHDTAAMDLASLNIFLSSGVSAEVATSSAIGMVGSFLAAGALIVVPAAFALIALSQNDALNR